MLCHGWKLARLLELISKGIRKASRNRDRVAHNSVIFRARQCIASFIDREIYAEYRENAPSLVSVRNKLPRSHMAQWEFAACYHYGGGVGFSRLLMAHERR